MERQEEKRKIERVIRQEEEKKRILKPHLDKFELKKDQYNFLDEYEKILKKEIRNYDKFSSNQMVDPEKQSNVVINKLDQQIQRAQMIVDNLEEVAELTAEDETDGN